MTEQAKFAYSLLGKAFEKQAKMIEEQGKALTEEELESLEGLFEKIWELMKLKMKEMRSKNGKIRFKM